ncbi:E3 ubiquitin-protein ligase RNF170-like isoform X2 [Durio zibethinus]|uniref:E3 ubiquitin-protein ligase RNF170 n=1 Tax=Durio zibethinus TaxID=66656 RepID=A0A6P6B8M0_DURZI|nr:E3 ubiquitin-protein ligase RNF170-like isoform X2 [Durio zibethinus]
MEGPPANDWCSICHGSFNVPCQANCSHWFCGNCIMLVWHHGSTFHPCKCPLCRRPITLLVPGEASLRERHNSAVAEILEKVEKYNHYFGGQSNGLIQMFLSAIYIFSPIDIIPEAILGIVGLLDDLLIVIVCFLHVAAIYRSVLYYRHGGS